MSYATQRNAKAYNKLALPPLTFIKTKKQLAPLIERYLKKKIIGIDTETVSVEDRTIVCFSVSDGTDRVTIDGSLVKDFAPIITNPAIKKVLHNGPFDFESFLQAGVRLQGFWADTMIMYWLLNENLFKYGLEVVCGDLFNVKLPSLSDIFGYVPKGKRTARVLPPLDEIWANKVPDIVLAQIESFYPGLTPQQALAEYAAKDPFYTLKSYFILKERLKEENLWDYYVNDSAPFTETLWRMERRGMPLNMEVFREVGNAVYAEGLRWKRLFIQAAGRDINLNSTKQMGELFFRDLKWPVIAHTKGSKNKAREAIRNGMSKDEAEGLLTPCLDAATLDEYAEQGYQLAVYLRNQRTPGTMLKTFIMPFFLKVSKDGRIRSSFNQIGAATGRLSSYSPNIQNIPAREEKDPHRIRRGFVGGHPDFSVISADFGGIELRVLAHLTRDKEMLKAYSKGGHNDQHSVTAKLVNPKLKNLTLKEIKEQHKDDRNKGKTANFAIIYGAQGAKIGTMIGKSEEEGEVFIKDYLNFFSGIKRYIQKTGEQLKAEGFVTTLAGRRRRLPEIWEQGHHNAHRRQRAERQAVNARIQGSAADIITRAMNALDRDKEFAKLGWTLNIQVHDELVCIGPKKHEARAKEIIKKHMSEAYADVLCIPLEVEAGAGPSWEEAKN